MAALAFSVGTFEGVKNVGHRQVLGVVRVGAVGLGSTPSQFWPRRGSSTPLARLISMKVMGPARPSPSMPWLR